MSNFYQPCGYQGKKRSNKHMKIWLFGKVNWAWTGTWASDLWSFFFHRNCLIVPNQSFQCCLNFKVDWRKCQCQSEEIPEKLESLNTHPNLHKSSHNLVAVRLEDKETENRSRETQEVWVTCVLMPRGIHFSLGHKLFPGSFWRQPNTD